MTGKGKSLGAVFDAHTEAEFQTRDIEATMATMGDAPHVTHIPTMTGGKVMMACAISTTPGSSAIGPMI